ncbi:hypothetical protein AGABI1DRAFT_134121 [Agaricus bisporus var. burnettii JB137-S8]|uniref:F-box domain-containing protein n=1 Tax=Agaricus bisporus var. burnettii (strain JB137-S8 / ATCC MYA-4627 / FGSC 10392) TaxID=597362 RepID=K5XH80_AGABU|nr:uncharacterized protein AGABI1DRAFT_134121 [Agaricus bisporus var. burnettii JB137-S8]EKM73770.1 hypothetical protein AGABI1DRAFT_134121 [Agaricus bisporus var. burnettii JB137-S8]
MPNSTNTAFQLWYQQQKQNEAKDGAAEFRQRLNYWHTVKMAQATDLPIELIDLILSFLPPNHVEQVQWRRAAAAIEREPRPTD